MKTQMFKNIFTTTARMNFMARMNGANRAICTTRIADTARSTSATTLAARAVVFAACGVALAGCGGDSARLSGHFIGAAGQKIILESVIPGRAGAMVDTLTANDKGEFSTRLHLPDGEPTIYNLRYEGDMVPLLVAPGERVSVMSMGDIAGYRVSGSPESELVWELHGILTSGATSLDSIYNRIMFAQGDSEREQLRRAYLDRYLRIKRRQISFIVEHASSLAAIYALYQRLPGDEVLFGGENDHMYYRMVADSVRVRYPRSRYLRALDEEVTARTNNATLQQRLETEMSEVNHPDIELPDMYGNKVKLSSLDGQVVVLDFWSATDTRSRLNNAELKELWNDLAARGMGVYQVSLDTDKALWVSTVQEQRLPWTTVCDFRGTATVAAGLYNLSAVPCNFVIDREGNIAARNLYGDALRRKVESLL